MAALPIDISALCGLLPSLPEPFRLSLPGLSIERINLMEVIEPLLAPLQPLFNIIDAIVAIFNCVKAVPEALTDPTILIQCIPEMGEKIAKLLQLLPQLTIPFLVIDVIDLVIRTLDDAVQLLVYLQVQLEQILKAIERATNLGDAGLSAILACAQENVEQESFNVGKALASIGKLIGLLNVFLGMIGLPEIPAFADLAGEQLDKVVEPIQAFVATLKQVRATIPIPAGGG